MSRSPAPNVGSFCLRRVLYDKRRWKAPDVREFAPNWIVMLRLPGKVRLVRSSSYAICGACLAVVGSPASVRPDCRCQKPARGFAEDWLRKEVRVWEEGRSGGMREEGARRGRGKAVKLSEVFGLYEVHGPQERKRQAAHGRQLLEQATGLKFEDLTMDVVRRDPMDLILKWAAMRQVYAQRGWSAKVGQAGVTVAPADAWVRLRREWEAGLIPRMPDKNSVRAVNTTIANYVRDLKCIFSPVSRTHYLPGLKLPETLALREVELALPRPKGFRRIAPERYREMWEAAKVLHEEDLQAWLALQLTWTTGLRTVELRGVRPHWLVKRVAPGTEEGAKSKSKGKNRAMVGTFLVLKSRPEEGFYLKAKFRGLTRDIRLRQDVVAAIERIQTSESVLGTLTAGQMTDLIKRVSAWIRQFIPDGPHTLYWFRHLAGALRYTRGDVKEAGSLLGHAPGSSATADTYIDLVDAVEALSEAELHPDSVGL